MYNYAMNQQKHSPRGAPPAGPLVILALKVVVNSSMARAPWSCSPITSRPVLILVSVPSSSSYPWSVEDLPAQHSLVISLQ